MAGNAFYNKLEHAVDKGYTQHIDRLLSQRNAPISKQKIFPIILHAIERSDKYVLGALLGSKKVTGFIQKHEWFELLIVCCKEGIRSSYPFLCVWEYAWLSSDVAIALKVAFEVAKIPLQPDFSLPKFRQIWGRMLDYKYIKTKLLSSKELFVSVWINTRQSQSKWENKQLLFQSLLNEFEVFLSGDDLKNMYKLPFEEAVKSFKASLQNMVVTRPCWEVSLSVVTGESTPCTAPKLPTILIDTADEENTACMHRLQSSSCSSLSVDARVWVEPCIGCRDRNISQDLRLHLSDQPGGTLQVLPIPDANSPYSSTNSIDTIYPSTGRHIVKVISLTNYNGGNLLPRRQSARIPDKLEEVLHELGCDVEIFKNPTAKEILDIVAMICQEAGGENQDASSLHLFFMGHGSFSKVIGTGGRSIKECDITALIGKAFPGIPKFFIFQKCQQGSGQCGLRGRESYPVNSPEMCVVHTCMPDCQDFDNDRGSLFMDSLIESLTKYCSGHSRRDFVQVLRHTSNKLKSSGQNAVVSSNLTKNFYFPSREP